MFHNEALAMRDSLTAFRREIHQDPEIGLELPNTQRRVLDALAELPLEITTGESLSSVVAVLRGGKPGPAVLLRADMDALPITEQSGREFSSKRDGAMHACGHDMHTTALVGAAKLLSAHREELAGNIVFMFQPGEEGVGGAEKMINEGVLDAAGERVVAAYGLHVYSARFPHGQFRTRPGTLMASTSDLDVHVIGTGGHAASPQLSADPVPVACELVTALQTAVTRQFNVFDPVILTVGSIHGGTARNVIPDQVTFQASVRTFSQETRAKFGELANQVCTRIANAHGIEAKVDFDPGYPALITDPREAAHVEQVVTETLGSDRYAQQPDPSPGGEDFSFVLQEVPGAFVFLGATMGEDHHSAPNNHSAQADFDDSLLPDAATLLAELAVRRLNRTDS